MRGEHGTANAPVLLTLGSSPHARGTLEGFVYFDCVIGIIPACAGNTHLQVMKTTDCRDHPRMRGEHPQGHKSTSMVSGSSPHARGTLVGDVGDAGAVGIIPACAGNTIQR